MAPNPTLVQIPQQRAEADWTAVYLLYDKAHNLIYVGITKDHDHRFGFYRRSDRWPGVARFDLRWYPTREQAERVERRAIRLLNPQGNIVGHVEARKRRSGTTYVRIAADLREGIVQGRFPPGSRLPTKERLCAQYAVAGQTVDKAKLVLRTEGLIIDRTKAGTFVVDPLPPAG